VSFPLGFGETFHGTLSGRENVRFIARVYGANVRHTMRYVEEFAELDGYFDMPVNTYSAGMRARLAFGTCLAIEFEVYLIDEVHTPDSSRYFYRDGYEERQKKGESQKQLSKEFVRQWLIENGFQGKEGQRVPEMTDQIVTSISDRYRELYAQVTGEKLPDINYDQLEERIEKSIVNSVK